MFVYSCAMVGCAQERRKSTKGLLWQRDLQLSGWYQFRHSWPSLLLLLEQILAISCRRYYSKKRLPCSFKPTVAGSGRAERPCSNLSLLFPCWRSNPELPMYLTWTGLHYQPVVMSPGLLCCKMVMVSIPGMVSLLGLY